MIAKVPFKPKENYSNIAEMHHLRNLKAKLLKKSLIQSTAPIPSIVNWENL